MSPRSILVVEVRGPGHHERAAAAASLLPFLSELGSVMVESTLRPRLAVDVEALLDAGAVGVVLDGPASTGVFRSNESAAMATDSDVVVRLVADAGPCRAEVVTGDESARRTVAAAIAALALDG